MELNQEQLDNIEILRNYKEMLTKVAGKEDTLSILRTAGREAGYKPAFRVLVMGKEPEKAYERG